MSLEKESVSYSQYKGHVNQLPLIATSKAIPVEDLLLSMFEIMAGIIPTTPFKKSKASYLILRLLFLLAPCCLKSVATLPWMPWEPSKLHSLLHIPNESHRKTYSFLCLSSPHFQNLNTLISASWIRISNKNCVSNHKPSVHWEGEERRLACQQLALLLWGI